MDYNNKIKYLSGTYIMARYLSDVLIEGTGRKKMKKFLHEKIHVRLMVRIINKTAIRYFFKTD
jgi:hypothetical protein